MHCQAKEWEQRNKSLTESRSLFVCLTNFSPNRRLDGRMQILGFIRSDSGELAVLEPNLDLIESGNAIPWDGKGADWRRH